MQWRVPAAGGLVRRDGEHGRVELPLMLPDGSKSLIPAVWTDLPEPASGAAGAGTHARAGAGATGPTLVWELPQQQVAAAVALLAA